MAWIIFVAVVQCTVMFSGNTRQGKGGNRQLAPALGLHEGILFLRLQLI